MADFHKDFIAFCFEQGVLKFGQFVTCGAALERLAQFYAKAILASGARFDMLLGHVPTAGTAVGGSLGLIAGRGAVPGGVVISPDRMERGQGELSAIQEIERRHGIPVVAVATLDDLSSGFATEPVFSRI